MGRVKDALQRPAPLWVVVVLLFVAVAGSYVMFAPSAPLRSTTPEFTPVPLHAEQFAAEVADFDYVAGNEAGDDNGGGDNGDDGGDDDDDRRLLLEDYVEEHSRSARVAVGETQLMSIFAMNSSAARGLYNIAIAPTLASCLATPPCLFAGLDDNGVWNRANGSRLQPGWEHHLEGIAARLAPHLGGAVRGIFVGDEVCCRRTACVDGTLRPVTDKLRELLGPSAVLWTNECWGLFYPPNVTIPPALDFISIDRYLSPTSANATGREEVELVRRTYEAYIFPKLAHNQSALLIPGTYGCTEAGALPLAEEDAQIAAKLDAYGAWAGADDRVGGLVAWHFNNRKTGQGTSGDPCDARTGLEALPRARAKLAQMVRAAGPLPPP